MKIAVLGGGNGFPVAGDLRRRPVIRLWRRVRAVDAHPRTAAPSASRISGKRDARIASITTDTPRRSPVRN